jgi:hypothetical protein
LAPPHCLNRLKPPIGNGCKLVLKVAGIRVHAIELVEENVRHCFIPPVVSARGIGTVKVDIFLRAAVKILLAHQDPVIAVLAAFINSGKGGPNYSRKDIYCLAVIRVRRSNNRMQPEARVAGVVNRVVIYEYEREVIPLCIQVKDKGVVAQGHLLPVTHFVWRGDIRHQFYSVYIYLLRKHSSAR